MTISCLLDYQTQPEQTYVKAALQFYVKKTNFPPNNIQKTSKDHGHNPLQSKKLLKTLSSLSSPIYSFSLRLSVSPHRCCAPRSSSARSPRRRRPPGAPFRGRSRCCPGRLHRGKTKRKPKEIKKNRYQTTSVPKKVIT